jgi:hypothetical protein
MVNITTIGVSLNCGVIPPLCRQVAKITAVGVSLNCGVIPPQNYFHPKVTITGIAYGTAPEAILTYQII